MKTISSEAYLAFDGTKFFDRDACRLYEQDEVLKPIAEKMARSVSMEAGSCTVVTRSGEATYYPGVRPSASSIRQFLRENRKDLLEVLQGMTP